MAAPTPRHAVTPKGTRGVDSRSSVAATDLTVAANEFALRQTLREIRATFLRNGSDALYLYKEVTQVPSERRAEAERIYSGYMARDRARFRTMFSMQAPRIRQEG